MTGIRLSEFSRARKAEARAALLGVYGPMVGAALTIAAARIGLSGLTLTFSASLGFGTVMYVLLSVPAFAALAFLQFGFVYMTMAAACGKPVAYADLFHGFQRDKADRVLRLGLFYAAIRLLCMLPWLLMRQPAQGGSGFAAQTLLSLACVGVYALVYLRYSMIFCLAIDFPEMPVGEILSASARMTGGHMGQLLYLLISFVPLYLLGQLSCGIADLWVDVYRVMSFTAVYCMLAGQKITMPEE